MAELEMRRIELPTGVTLDVQTGGPREAEPIVLLHGFPESHRTWRSVAPELARDHYVVAPDQRGFAGSDRPDGVEAYRTERIVEDLVALADSLSLKQFTLVGHDWGGAVAWLAALRHPNRVSRLIAINAPHPLIFQKSLVENAEQREASQYITAFRNPAIEAGIAAMGLDTFFDKTFGRHADLAKIPAEERQVYIDQWSRPGALTAMLNWYRASDMVVPQPGENAALPAWTHLPFPHVTMPTLVIWGLGDQALLPVQLDGLDALVDDLRVAATPDAGHFIPWEYPEFVVSAIRDFVAETSPS
jgi:pimeloyl-ACP methyl ester carboxylesterase